jgi:hypothetical protein
MIRSGGAAGSSGVWGSDLATSTLKRVEQRFYRMERSSEPHQGLARPAHTGVTDALQPQQSSQAFDAKGAGDEHEDHREVCGSQRGVSI